MDLEERLDQIETGMLHLAQEDAAKDLLLLAIIATHPHPAGLKAALQAMLSGNELKAADAGFQQDWSPHQVQALNAGLRPIVERWIRQFPAA